MKQEHPDLHPSVEADYQEKVEAAYEVLLRSDMTQSLVLYLGLSEDWAKTVNRVQAYNHGDINGYGKNTRLVVDLILKLAELILCSCEIIRRGVITEEDGRLLINVNKSLCNRFEALKLMIDSESWPALGRAARSAFFAVGRDQPDVNQPEGDVAPVNTGIAR